MAAVDIGARSNPPKLNDNLDDLFDYTVPADIFQDVDTDMEAPQRPAKVPMGLAGKDGDLGIDEEIKVTKRRVPIAKLDEDRLLSSAGIPRLDKITKERLRFKGKRHEYSDVARLLNIYQLWLDDLYPRAKFADGLAMIERLGHKRKLQIMRKEWIKEGRSKESSGNIESIPEISERHQVSSGAIPHAVSAKDTEPIPEMLASKDPTSYDRPSFSQEIEKKKAGDNSNETLFISEEKPSDDVPSEDDLDALLAEDEINRRTTSIALQEQDTAGGKEHVNFDDEMEAMAALDDMW